MRRLVAGLPAEEVEIVLAKLREMNL